MFSANCIVDFKFHSHATLRNWWKQIFASTLWLTEAISWLDLPAVFLQSIANSGNSTRNENRQSRMRRTSRSVAMYCITDYISGTTCSLDRLSNFEVGYSLLPPNSLDTSQASMMEDASWRTSASRTAQVLHSYRSTPRSSSLYTPPSQWRRDSTPSWQVVQIAEPHLYLHHFVILLSLVCRSVTIQLPK